MAQLVSLINKVTHLHSQINIFGQRTCRVQVWNLRLMKKWGTVYGLYDLTRFCYSLPLNSSADLFWGWEGGFCWHQPSSSSAGCVLPSTVFTSKQKGSTALAYFRFGTLSVERAYWTQCTHLTSALLKKKYSESFIFYILQKSIKPYFKSQKNMQTMPDKELMMALLA